MQMPAGGAGYKQGILFCSQGNLNAGTGGLYYMPIGRPPEPVVTHFFGRDFNSPQDVVVANDGAIWFIDSFYGFEHEIRSRPAMPCQILRYEPDTGQLRVMAEDVERPRGLALSPDETTLYITDSSVVHNIGDKGPTRYRLSLSLSLFKIQSYY
jgi:gluconolactonase